MMSIEDLTANVLEAAQQHNDGDLMILLLQLQEVLSVPGDKSCLIGPVVKLLPSHNVEIKRRAYSCLQKLCENHPDAALLAANCIVRDCRDPNPEVKCLGVWAISVLPPLLPLYAPETLATALGDPHPRVRRTAVTACGKVFISAPGLLEEHGFVNRLYKCIRDEDTVVVVQALLVLDRALVQEGGIVVNRKLAQYLLLRLPNFQPPQLATVLQVLRKYIPKTESELFTQLSLLDPYLAHKESAAVVVNCVQLFLQLIETGHPHLEKDVIARAVPALISFLGASETLAQGYVLDFLLWAEGREVSWLVPFSDYWQLFCPPRSSSAGPSNLSPESSSIDTALLYKKLLLLPRVCSLENASEVFQTLESTNWNRSDSKLCRALLDCIVSLVILLPQPASSQALRLLIRFIESKEVVVVESALRTLERLNVSKLPADEVSPLLVGIVTSVDICKDTWVYRGVGKVYSHPPAVLPEILSERAESMAPQTAPHILEALVLHLPILCQSYSYVFALQILQSAMHAFLLMPARFQRILGRALHICVQYEQILDRNNAVNHIVAQHLKKRALWYYSLLKADPSAVLAKSVMLGSS